MGLRPLTRYYRQIISVISNDCSIHFTFFLVYHQRPFTLTANLKHNLSKMWQKAVRNHEQIKRQHFSGKRRLIKDTTSPMYNINPLLTLEIPFIYLWRTQISFLWLCLPQWVFLGFRNVFLDPWITLRYISGPFHQKESLHIPFHLPSNLHQVYFSFTKISELFPTIWRCTKVGILQATIRSS